MIITKLDVDTLQETSINVADDIKPVDELAMYKYLNNGRYNNYIYINWEKHLFSKDLGKVI